MGRMGWEEGRFHAKIARTVKGRRVNHGWVWMHTDGADFFGGVLEEGEVPREGRQVREGSGKRQRTTVAHGFTLMGKGIWTGSTRCDTMLGIRFFVGATFVYMMGPFVFADGSSKSGGEKGSTRSFLSYAGRSEVFSNLRSAHISPPVGRGRLIWPLVRISNLRIL
jgi:hypothetical protein